MPVDALTLSLMILLLLLSFFFSGSETAFLTSNKTLMEFKAKQMHKKSGILLRYLRRPESFLVVILIGNNVFAVSLTTIATIELERFIQPQVSWLIITMTILFIGELIPKSVSGNIADRILPTMVPFVKFFEIAFKPLIWIVEGITSLFFRILHIPTEDFDRVFTRKELKNIILETSPDVVKGPENQDFIEHLFELEKTNIRSIMVPRTEVVALPETTSVKTLRMKFIQKKVSRILIFKDDLDNLSGYVHFRDLLFTGENWHEKIYPILFFPETKKLGGALAEFKAKQENIAAVIDEHGGIEGVVTIEDILENILGEILDEFDFEEDNISPIRKGVFMVSAHTPVLEFNESLGMNIPESDEYQTISGYLLKEIGGIPKVGEEILIENKKIVVIEATRTGAKLLRVEPNKIKLT